MGALRERDPDVTCVELDEDVAEIEYSLGHYYRDDPIGLGEVPPGLDGAIRAIFDDLGGAGTAVAHEPLAPAAALIRRLEPELLAQRVPLDRPLPRANPGPDPLPGGAGRAPAAGVPAGPGGGGDRGGDDAGDGAGDESRAAGQLPAVSGSGGAGYFGFLCRASARSTIRSISRR